MQTDFIMCPMLYATAMGQIKILCKMGIKVTVGNENGNGNWQSGREGVKIKTNCCGPPVTTRLSWPMHRTLYGSVMAPRRWHLCAQERVKLFRRRTLHALHARD